MWTATDFLRKFGRSAGLCGISLSNGDNAAAIWIGFVPIVREDGSLWANVVDGKKVSGNVRTNYIIAYERQ